MADPTLYFPDDVLFELIEGGFQHRTIVSEAPSGRKQQTRSLSGDEPMRTFACRVQLGDSTSTAYSSSVAGRKDFLQFLRSVNGRTNRFGLFNPKLIDADYYVTVETIGGVVQGLPLTLPFRAGPGAAFDDVGLLDVFEIPGAFAFDPFWLGSSETWTGNTDIDSTDHDLIRIVDWAISPDPGDAIYTIKIELKNVYERIWMRMDSDRAPFTFDISAADPPTQVSLAMTEAD